MWHVLSSAQTLAERIREARLNANLTQEQLAELIGTGRRRVIAWEAAQNEPRIKFLWRIADATGVPITDLVGADIRTIKRAINDEIRQEAA